MIRNCIICKTKTDVIVGTLKSDLTERISCLKCKDCHHFFTSEISKTGLGTESVNSVVTPDYYVEGLISASYSLSSSFLAMASNRLDFFKSKLGKHDLKILEIGAGSGNLGLGFIKSGLPVSNYTGIEMDVRLFDRAKSNGLKVICGDFFNIDLANEKYDVICFSQVLEHILEPVEFLKKCKKYLSEDGHSMIYFDVPNHYSLAGSTSRYFGGIGARLGGLEWPNHLSSYSLDSTGTLLYSVFGTIAKLNVISCNPNHKIFGQGSSYSFVLKLFFMLAKVLNKKSMIVSYTIT